ncbi:CopD family protein [Plastoroseomonas arctica]|uniref:Copper resistance protein D domain-containing protein n=1 Tax=Plastoroseomonas arctica TaxID=1509237 RepID=A0AAF1JYW3_9PROT|nr:CopD family protein [Plastoroseomonas arctica]MBR0657362.1 hypothetical protein [Plastoroseomonas arctica]
MLSPLYALHLLGAVIWVGGMAFALFALRPAAHATLEGAQRLALMQLVYRRFFLIVWHAMPIVIATGYAILFLRYGGFAGVGWHVHVMNLTGLIMAGIFVAIALGPLKRMKAARAGGDNAAAAGALDQVRKLVTLNLALGLLTIAVAGWGRA